MWRLRREEVVGAALHMVVCLLMLNVMLLTSAGIMSNGSTVLATFRRLRHRIGGHRSLVVRVIHFILAEH